MLTKARYEVRKLADQRKWIVFDTFVQEPAHANEHATVTAAARAVGAINRAYEQTLQDREETR